jgi:hypothetical protein
VIGLDADSGRLAVEMELTKKGEQHSFMAKETNLLALPARPRTAAALQELVDMAGDGCRVSIPTGKFVASDACKELVIKGAITLAGKNEMIRVLGGAGWTEDFKYKISRTSTRELQVAFAMIAHPRLGAAAAGGGLEDSIVHLIVEATFEENRRNESALHFPVSVSADACGDLLHLATFSVVDAPLNIGGKNIKRAKIQKLQVSLVSPRWDAKRDKDALVLNSIGPTSCSVLVEDCDVRGGSDGVYVNTNFVHLLNCHIHEAQSRGIFGQYHYVIENSMVWGCGGYGMKTRGGCERRGRNSIQAGPWDMICR